jgi:hypothetical protein
MAPAASIASTMTVIAVPACVVGDVEVTLNCVAAAARAAGAARIATSASRNAVSLFIT